MMDDYAEIIQILARLLVVCEGRTDHTQELVKRLQDKIIVFMNSHIADYDLLLIEMTAIRNIIAAQDVRIEALEAVVFGDDYTPALAA